MINDKRKMILKRASDPRRPLLNSNRVVFREGIRGVGGDDVANPAERAARAKPESWGDD